MNGKDCAAHPSDFSAADTPAGCFTALQKRWFTLDTSAMRLKHAEADDYAAKLSTFNTEAAAYNGYIAKVKEMNAKANAFTDFFSPPEKPAFVKRPSVPRMPAVTTNYLQHWAAAKQRNFAKTVGGAANQPTAYEYIPGNYWTGGWGHWTISRLVLGTNRDPFNNAIAHSFGMLGVTTTGAAASPTANNRSFLKNWQTAAGKNPDTYIP